MEIFYNSCLTTLKNVEWIVHFEDDVWFKRRVKGTPPYDLTGILGIGWHENLYKHLNTDIRGAHGCGGSIVNREKFIEAYKNVKNIDWDFYDELAVNPKPSEWTDSALTFIFLYSKFTVGTWSELTQYRHSKFKNLTNRSGWGDTIENLEQEQGDVSIIHCMKPYYFPTTEEREYVSKELQLY